MEAAAQEDRALVSVGRAVAIQFATLSKQLDNSYQREFVNEQQRYEIWALTLGLYHRGHSSLDYRFRDSPRLFDYAFTLLEDLSNALSILASTTDSATVGSSNHDDKTMYADDDISMSDDEPEEDFSSYEVGHLKTEYITNISITVDRLYELSFRIRNPRMRSGLSRALRYTEIDPSTGIDPIEDYKPMDLYYMKAAFRAWGKVFDVDNYFLVYRLATANTHRRQQFRYWERRRLKYDYYHHDAMSAQVQQLSNSRIDREGSVAPSEPSTATTLDMDKMNEDTASVISTDSYAMISHDDAENINLPSPPELEDSQKEAECPFCFIICSRNAFQNPAWRKHVMRDLRPYVCTFENCRDPHQQYESLTEWVLHESSNHGVQPKSCRDCPFCPQSNIDVYHVARHLRKVSTFSLPEIEGDDDAAPGTEGPTDDTTQDPHNSERGSTDHESDGDNEWSGNNKTAHFILGEDSVALEIRPTESLEENVTDYLRAEFSIDDSTTLQFVDANRHPVLFDYDSIYDDMQIYVHLLSREVPDDIDQELHGESDTVSPQENDMLATSLSITPGHPDNPSNILDTRYGVHHAGYFQPGKVFSILWHEIPGRVDNGTEAIAGPTYVGRFGEPIYSRIRLLVLFKAFEQYSWCFAITTYGGRGVAKPGVDPSKHAPVYISDTYPIAEQNEQLMAKEPIRVEPDRLDEPLHSRSTINFGKIYTVQHNVNILPIGKISEESMPRFLQYTTEEVYS
ncbi:hypothetical protein BJX99DRAFT_258326 [Aspergillus californicus]